MFEICRFVSRAFFTLSEIGLFAMLNRQQVMPDNDSRLVPLLPIPNRTVKRFCADDSAVTSVKVGYCQAMSIKKPPVSDGRLFCCVLNIPQYSFLSFKEGVIAL